MGGVYYNEIDSKKAAMLKSLMGDGHIPVGDIDTRSIKDVKANEIKGYIQCHFFAGIGLWAYALALASWPTDRPVWTGSCPCQPYSSAQGKRAAQQDERNLWPDWARLIAECHPTEIFGEQVNDAITYGWLDDAFLDLETACYACAAAVLPAISVGDAHERRRIFFVANSISLGLSESRWHNFNLKADEKGQDDSFVDANQSNTRWLECPDGKRRPVEPSIRLLANGYPHSMAILHAIGDAIDPKVAAEFIKAAM